MAYFEWAGDMEIDQGPIDEDHRKLVQQVNDLHTATTDGRGTEVVAKLLAELLDDTAAHIHREEVYMHTLGYPELERHKQGHVRFMDQLRALQAKYDAGSVTVASQLSSVLRDWLSLHIRRHDKAIVAFLRERQRKETRAALAQKRLSVAPKRPS